MGKAQIEDTYAEAFTGIFCRVIVTADDEETLRKAAEDSTATPSVVIGRTEGGVEKYLTPKRNPRQTRRRNLTVLGRNQPEKNLCRIAKKIRN